MPNLHQHHATILAVLLALFLSSVGLPVIIVACQMGSDMGATVMARNCCGSCLEDVEPDERFASIPCQMQYQFIERNTTAYVPAKRGADHPPLQILAVLSPTFFIADVVSPVSCSSSESPPLTRDIPILISTLLI